MRIVLFAEGKTERACKVVLKALIDRAAAGEGKTDVGLRIHSYNGSEILDLDTVSRDAIAALGAQDVAGVIVLVDVYPRFASADETREYYSRCVGSPRFRAHCALHDFEAWLLPLWARIYDLSGRKPKPKQNPWPRPENVDLQKPPSYRLRELFAAHRGYEKTLDGPRILRTADDLCLSAAACPELRAFLNTLLEFAGLRSRVDEAGQLVTPA